MFSTKAKLKKCLIRRAVPTILPHNSKRNTGDDYVLKEAVKRVKVNILSDIRIIPSSSFLDEPSTSGQLSVDCGMEESSCSNMSGNLLIKVDNLEETPSSLISPSAMTQTPASLSSQSPRKQKLRENNIKKKCCEKVLNTEKKLSLDDFDKICDQFLSRNLADIVKIQSRLESR
ncbi:hypothetical protein JTB14_035326 [Gonioctena quinquepunctata]|nr:hypothetical protein JTB14_035326 [Gonioctena quinquepunctata]